MKKSAPYDVRFAGCNEDLSGAVTAGTKYLYARYPDVIKGKGHQLVLLLNNAALFADLVISGISIADGVFEAPTYLFDDITIPQVADNSVRNDKAITFDIEGILDDIKTSTGQIILQLTTDTTVDGMTAFCVSIPNSSAADNVVNAVQSA